MFKVKLWITVLLYVAAGALLVLLGTPRLHEALLPPLERRADNVATAVKAELVLDSERALTAAASLTASPEVRQLLETGSDDPSEEALATLRPTLEGRLGQPAFTLLIDAKGAVRVRAGEDPGFEDAIGGVPVVAEALRGVLRDALMQMNGAAYHSAVAPLYEGGKLTGAVLLGFPYDDAYVDSISEAVGEPVLFVVEGKKVGTSLPDVNAASLEQITSGTGFGEFQPELPLPLPLLIPETTGYLGTAAAAFPGEQSVRYAAIVDRSGALNTIAFAQAAVLVATFVPGFIIFLLVLSILGSVSRPMQQIMDHLSQYAQGNPVGILPESALSGPFVRLGKQINMILQAPPPGSQPRSGASPLTPAPPTDPGMKALTPSGEGPTPPAAPSTDPGVKEAALAFEGLGPPNEPEPGDDLLPVRSAPVSEELVNSGLSGLFDEASADPLAAFRTQGGEQAAGKGGPPSPPPPESSLPAPASPGAAALPGSAAAGPPQPPQPQQNELNPEATVMFQVPDALIQESAASGGGPSANSQPPAPAPRPPAPARQPEHEEEARTVIAQIPPELLNRSAGAGATTPEEDAHFQEVFKEFVRIRAQCGEDTDQLTFDRFVAKLMKNRQQIIEKYNSRSVRFQVYVKQGKAALRAVPVRD